jgi:hypothetical protein
VRPFHKPTIDAAPNPFWDALRFENTSYYKKGPLRRRRSLINNRALRAEPAIFHGLRCQSDHAGLTTKYSEIEMSHLFIKNLTLKSFRFKDRRGNLLLTP